MPLGKHFNYAFSSRIRRSRTTEFRTCVDILNFFRSRHRSMGREKKNTETFPSPEIFLEFNLDSKFPTSYEFSIRQCFPRENRKNRIRSKFLALGLDVGKFFERNHANLTFRWRREAEVRFWEAKDGSSINRFVHRCTLDSGWFSRDTSPKRR